MPATLRRHADAVTRGALACGLTIALGWMRAARSGLLGVSDPVPAGALVATAGL